MQQQGLGTPRHYQILDIPPDIQAGRLLKYSIPGVVSILYPLCGCGVVPVNVQKELFPCLALNLGIAFHS